MADLHKDFLEEQFSDAALRLLMEEYAESNGENLLSSYEKTKQQMPSGLDKKCQEQIQKYHKETEKGVLLRRTASRAGKIAAVFAVFLVLSVNLVLSVEAIRVPFLNFCFETRRYFSSLTFQSDEDAQASTTSDDAVSLPISAPKGYSIFAKQHNHDDFDRIYEDSNLLLGYQNDEGKIFSIHTFPAEGSLSIDTEDADHTEFLLNGMQAIYIKEEADGMFRTIWIDAERKRVYDISCNGLAEEAFKQKIFELSGMFMAPELYAD